MRFVVSGGGTGGHVYPALAIARGLKDKYPAAEILFLGSKGGLEAELVPGAGFDFQGIKLTGFKRRLSFHNLLACWQAARGFAEVLRIMDNFKPAAVIGTGGYVCGPVVLAASFCRIPTLIHEQNALPGVTNRLLSYIASTVAITFPDAVRYLPRRTRVKFTGLPVRPEFMSCTRQESRRALGLPEEGRLVLSFGGSQGARTINNAMVEVLSRFSEKSNLYFLHVTGPGQYDNFVMMMSQRGVFFPDNGNNTIKPYLHEMPLALAAADLVICRAGAATLAEITVAGKPAILIPYPYATGNHQEFNARFLKNKGAAVMIRDGQLTGEMLAAQIERLLADPLRLEEMSAASRKLGHPRALEKILACVEEIITKHK